MSFEPPVVVERITRVTPLGVRFWDAATRRYIGDLAVTASSLTRPHHRLRLSANPAGVYVLQGVPGLREFEFGEGDEAFWAQPPPSSPYMLAVSDPQRRFLPFVCEVDVPTHGLFRWACGPQASPPEPGSGDIPLYAAPGRPAPVGMAAVYAELFDPLAGRPAAWAVLELHDADTMIGRGIAGAAGQVLVLVPYPQPVDFLPLSPLVTGAPIWQQEWALGVRVAYAPDVFSGADGAGEGPVDLCAALLQLDRPPARVWRDAARTTLLTEAVLKFGHNLVLRSWDAGKPLPKLLIAPAA